MILLRHGQSEFNLRFTATRRDPGIPDPSLTDLGRQQAEAAADALADAGLRRIVASPYTRAMQTAAPVARRLGLPVEIDAAVRERYAFSCDIGSPCSVLAPAWPAHDFAQLDEVWWPAAEEPDADVARRAAAFRRRALAHPDWRHTLVVSHWGFLLALTGESLENGGWLRWRPDQPPDQDSDD